MGWSIRIARVFGTDVKIHLTFLLLLGWIWFEHYRLGGADEAWQGVLFIILLFLCVLLHEFGHVFAARAYGIKTPDITLLPIGGVARLERMPEKPSQELVVAIAGPLVNVVIAGALFLVLKRIPDPEDAARIEDPRVDMLVRLTLTNVWLVVFNMIPAFPMDGGRVLRAALAMTMSHARATQVAARIGQALAFVLGFIGLVTPGGALLIFIAIFIYLGAAAEAGMAQFKDATRGITVAEAMVTRFLALPVDARIDQAVEALLRTTQHEFPVVDASGRMVGILTRDDLIRGLRETGPATPVVEVMHPDVPMVQPTTTFDHAFRLMQERGCPGLGVVNSDGRLVGLLTPEAVGDIVMIRSIVPPPTTSSDGRPPWRRPPVRTP